MVNIIEVFDSQEELLKKYKKTDNYKIKDLFENYWKKFLDYADDHNYDIRLVVYKEIDKMLKCKTYELGYSVYKCPTCDNETVVSNTYKSRICSSCGVKYSKQRTQNIMEHLYNCKHRHIIFTIPSCL